MTNIEEFSLIAEQLAWLEQHVRAQPTSPAESDRVEEALKALVCARAVIEQLAQIGALIDSPTAVSPA
jgi:hypothetical protein